MYALSPFLACASISITGTTLSGMEFSGTLAELHDETIFLQSSSSTAALKVGIPLKSVDSLALQCSLSDGALLMEMEACTILLPYLSKDTLAAVMERVLTAAENWSWESLYLWSERIEKIVVDPPLRAQASLKKIRALLELGDLQTLEKELRILNTSMDAVTAPAELCWINAEFLLRTGKFEEARFWSELPRLQVPPSRKEMPGLLVAFLKERESGISWENFNK